MIDTKSILSILQERRRNLGLPYGVLAKQSNLGQATVQRALNGETNARLDTIVSIADSLGLSIKLSSIKNTGEIRKEQAERKAEQIVAMAQGTAALEAQGVNEDVIQQAKENLTHKLLAGSKSGLWSE